MSYIEQTLCEKAATISEAKKYVQQWELAKDYVPQILNTISHFFPHYSLHDATHSQTILNNIELIMGRDVISKLSVVDLWLLLTAAYYHDLGMVVTKEDKVEYLKNGSKFVEYVVAKQKDTNSPMYEYAKCFEVKDGRLFYRNCEITAENIDSQKFLIADFVRSSHAERSNTYVNNASSLHLPGNPIPERIIKLLGRICHAHTQSQEQLLSLPVEENSGCGTEKCHPLFVACMLRLGDLLDIDTNRVSAVLLSTLPSIPCDSQAYNQTNRDITHLNIDRKVVEITAECSEYKVAELLNGWFKMIDEELAFQTRNWYKIAPSVDFGSLPSVGQLIVKLKGWDDISGKNRLRFDIDNTKAIRLLQGAGLYNDASQCIRELLQNSVDAIYLRTFVETPSITDMNKFWDECRKRKIKVELDKHSVGDENVQWHLRITDEGIGMAPEEMIFLSKTGSSDQNEQKNKIVEQMPAWMKPSGTFGIGFQSIFLITDKVNMRTRKLGAEHTVELELYNPAGPEKGNILKRTYKDNTIPFGTVIECDILFHRHSGWTVHSGERASLETICTYDFARDQSLDIEAAKLVDEIEKFKELSRVDVELYKDGEHISYGTNTPQSYEYYDKETGIQVTLGSKYHRTALYYRNQYVEKFKTDIELLNFSVNILKGDAKDLLELSRNDVRMEARDSVSENVRKAVCRYLIDGYEKFDKEIKYPSTEIRPLAAAFLESNREFIEYYHQEIKQFFPTDWQRIKIYGVNDKGKETACTIRKLLNYYRVECVNVGSREELQFFGKTKKKASFTTNHNSGRMDVEVSRFLRGILHTQFPHISYTAECIVLSKDYVGDLIENTVAAKERWFKVFLSRGAYARGYMPCVSDYEKLRIKERNNDWTFRDFGCVYPIMLCPYVKSAVDEYSVFIAYKKLVYRVDDIVVDYVYEHRYDEATTKQEICEAFERFRTEYQPIVDRVNGDD